MICDAAAEIFHEAMRHFKDFKAHDFHLDDLELGNIISAPLINALQFMLKCKLYGVSSVHAPPPPPSPSGLCGCLTFDCNL